MPAQAGIHVLEILDSRLRGNDAARQIIEHPPEQATCDDIMYELYVKQKIEEGLKAADVPLRLIHNQSRTSFHS